MTDQDTRRRRSRGSGRRRIELTDREKGVLSLSAAGHGARTIADIVGFENMTRVKRIKGHIKHKLGLPAEADTAAKLAAAKQHGLID